MKRLIPFLLALVLLYGCSSAGIPQNTLHPLPTQTTSAPTVAVTEGTSAPTEPAAVYRHPLNGAILEEPWNGRPVTFTVGNTDDAHPQFGLAKADILCEIAVEGGATRCMPIYSDLSAVNAIGSIRSARSCLISIAQAYGAILVHTGSYGPDYGSINLGLVDNVNGDPAIFYQDTDRMSQGYAVEHCYFVNGANCLDYLQKQFPATNTQQDLGLTFVDQQSLTGDSAQKVRVNFGEGYAKATSFVFDGNRYTTNLYTQAMEETPWLDGETNQPLCFENLLILYAEKTTAPGKDITYRLVGSNEGYYISGGKVVPIKWSRKNEDSSFTFTLTDGTPLNVIPGKTYIGFVPTGSPVEFE